MEKVTTILLFCLCAVCLVHASQRLGMRTYSAYGNVIATGDSDNQTNKNISFDTFGNVETNSSISETSLIPADNPL